MVAPKPNSMRTLPPESAVARFSLALARRLWIALVLALVVGAGAIIQYARPSASWRHAYVATQALRIIVAPGTATTTYDAYETHQETDGIARAIARGGIFSTPTFIAAMDRLLVSQHAKLAARYGSDVPGDVSPADLASALAASDSGDSVTLTCRWNSPAGTNALLSSAVTVLAGADDLRSLLPVTALAQTSDSVLAYPTGAFGAAHLDNTVASAAWQELLMRIALGLLVGLLVAALLASLTLRNSTIRLPETASTPDSTLAGKR